MTKTDEWSEDNETVESDWVFDALLDNSSLGAPAALAVGALTPPNVTESLADALDARSGLVTAGPDDLMLDVVRSAMGIAGVLPLTGWARALADDPDRCVASARVLVRELLVRGLFAHVRPDIARSIVELGFTSHGRLPKVVIAACQWSVGSSKIADEVIAASR